MIRVGSINAGSAIRRAITIDYRLTAPSEILAKIDRGIGTLEAMVHRAGKSGCDIAVLPEDTLCTTQWEAAHDDLLEQVLPQAITNMCDRLGKAASSHNMYLICSNDHYASGVVQNTAYFLGRNGKKIGCYHKVCLPVQESLKKPGSDFPVFETPDLGGVGMLICYDMVFPETARCLTLGGADIIFNPTVGGAAFGGPEISRAAFRTRAVENFVYIVVSWGGWGSDTGSMIISPKGEILSEEKTAGGIAIADIDPTGNRQMSDWCNHQDDMRARIFRERRPETFNRLTENNPPALQKWNNLMPGPPEDIARMMKKATTIGHAEYAQADQLLRDGKTEEAIQAFEKLIKTYPCTWFDRTAKEKLAILQKQTAHS